MQSLAYGGSGKGELEPSNHLQERGIRVWNHCSRTTAPAVSTSDGMTIKGSPMTYIPVSRRSAAQP